MHTLPPELLLMIFKFACFINNISDTRTTIRISHVSRAWRRLCLASPALWSNISYHSPLGYHRNYVALQKVMTYIGRSGNSPLHLDLELYAREDEGFQIICEHSVRWKSLSLKCAQGLMPTISWRLRKAPVPILEYLYVQDVPTGRNQEEDSSGPSPLSQGKGPFSIFSGGSPKLRVLELKNGAVYYMRPVHLETLSTIHFSSAFNDLELTSSDDYEVMRIFATVSCPLVEVLMLQNISGTSWFDPPSDIYEREPEVLWNLDILQLEGSCDISLALHRLLAQICRPLKEIVFDTGLSESPSITSILLPREDGNPPTRPTIFFPELHSMVLQSVDKTDAQSLLILLPGFADQGRPIEKVALGLEIASVWLESGHGDWLREMRVEIYVEDDRDPKAPLWTRPRRTLIWRDGDQSTDSG
ncbi:hypothetical protein AN958_00717 [Leucoagaricus sp. SymC.cos]|nr:hypothetical protein AN958_00717 [Leucoagaricus sp. SymC.cos]